ncbi:MAG TPA: zinc-dependent metalloprotease [Ignavibacteria bacterium]|nr:zinc-dependent metalloprotease [Ignavibacteria bacterium]HMQ97496.1 zinc-dependent metalloprotease [Ignavibacteria bacterium]
MKKLIFSVFIAVLTLVNCTLTNANAIKLFDVVISNNVSEKEYKVSKGSILKTLPRALDFIMKGKKENFEIEVPISTADIFTVELSKQDIYSDDFKIVTSGGLEDFSRNGLFYSGKVIGEQNSLVAFSFFNDYVMGIISVKGVNYCITKINGNDNHYIVYKDNDMTILNDFRCNVADGNYIITPDMVQEPNVQNYSFQRPLKLYFETDFSIYQAQGSIPNVQNYVTSLFNSVKTIYQNESIPLEISQIFIWNSADPYIPFNNTNTVIRKFGQLRQDSFNGDVGHLLSARELGGGFAWMDVLCRNYDPVSGGGRFAVCSGLNPDVIPYPAYSWNLFQVSHELGHNFGSPHTHSCSWPGGIIDTCFVPVEGSCYSGSAVPRFGTVMSYCHTQLANGGGINFGLGFGPLPGNLIRNKYNSAPCLVIGIQPVSNEIPEKFDLSQNYPNPFNPGTMILFSIPKSLFAKLTIFDATGRMLAILVNEELRPGKYEVEWDASQHASGVYYYKMETDNFTETKKMILLK